MSHGLPFRTARDAMVQHGTADLCESGLVFNSGRLGTLLIDFRAHLKRAYFVERAVRLLNH